MVYYIWKYSFIFEDRLIYPFFPEVVILLLSADFKA